MKLKVLIVSLFCLSSFVSGNIGFLVSTTGNVHLLRDGSKVIVKKGNMALKEKDEVIIGDRGFAQVYLNDETVLSLYEKTRLSLDTFSFNKNRSEGNVLFEQKSGRLRFYSGKISEHNPASFRIKVLENTIQVGKSIGVSALVSQKDAKRINPNVFRVETTFSKRSPAQLSVPQAGAPIVFAALVGPGPLTQANATTGSFNFSTPNGDVDLSRPGAAVLASPGAPPVFFLAPPGATQTNTSGLADNSDDGGNDDSGGDIDLDESETLDPTNDADTSDTIAGIIQDSNEVNDLVDSSDINNEARDFAGSLQELIALNSGTVGGSGSFTGDITGNFDYLINFAARTFDLQATNLNSAGLAGDSIVLAGGSATLPNDTRTSLTVGPGQSFSGTASGDCSACILTATFPTSSSISATIQNGSNSGSTGQIEFTPN